MVNDWTSLYTPDMVGYKVGALFIQRNLVDLHNSEHNVSLKKKQDEKYSEESP